MPDLSGLAQTLVSGDKQYSIVILGGLMGPTIAGALMLILTRGFNLYRLALTIIFIGLVATLVFWSGSLFTSSSVAIAAMVIGAIVLRGPDALAFLAAHFIAISFCLNAVAGFDYFFMSRANVGGSTHRSDIGTLSEIMFGSQMLWAIGLAVSSLIVLAAAFMFSNALARRSQRIAQEKRVAKKAEKQLSQ